MSGGVELTLLVLKTRQPDALRAFYEAIGISFVAERHGEGPLHYAGKVGGTVLELYPLSGEGNSADTTTRLGFAVENLQQVLASLRDAGATVASEPRQTAWGVRVLVRDPDGRAVELERAVFRTNGQTHESEPEA
jgi:predicted enzyme related to lactoylglutathione lyase